MKRILKNNVIIILVIITAIFLIYWLYRPVIIVNVYKDRHWSHIIVKNFPITKTGKVAWWKRNQVILREKYNIPTPDKAGFFGIIIWRYGDGYEIEPYSERANELICFSDMPTETNCLEKHVLLEIRRERSSDREYYY